MAPSSSAESLRSELAAHAAALHELANESIRTGFDLGEPLSVALSDHPETLRRRMASFVTLRHGGELRGCVGTAYAVRALVEDIAYNAFHAAFSDPRFPPLVPAEFNSIAIELSLLTPFEPISFDDEDDLAAQLVPGRDGLMLECRSARGLFLPQVWETLSDRREFLDHLKAKAHLPPAPLGAGVRALRFEALKIADHHSALMATEPS